MLGGVAIIDWLVILLYLLTITVIGIWAVRRVKSAASFFIGDCGFGRIMMMFFAFGTGTHSDQAVSVSVETYRSGVWAGTLVSFTVLLFTSKISMLGVEAWRRGTSTAVLPVICRMVFFSRAN